LKKRLKERSIQFLRIFVFYEMTMTLFVNAPLSVHHAISRALLQPS